MRNVFIPKIVKTFHYLFFSGVMAFSYVFDDVIRKYGCLIYTHVVDGFN